MWLIWLLKKPNDLQLQGYWGKSSATTIHTADEASSDVQHLQVNNVNQFKLSKDNLSEVNKKHNTYRAKTFLPFRNLLRISRTCIPWEDTGSCKLPYAARCKGRTGCRLLYVWSNGRVWFRTWEKLRDCADKLLWRRCTSRGGAVWRTRLSRSLLVCVYGFCSWKQRSKCAFV